MLYVFPWKHLVRVFVAINIINLAMCKRSYLVLSPDTIQYGQQYTIGVVIETNDSMAAVTAVTAQLSRVTNDESPDQSPSLTRSVVLPVGTSTISFDNTESLSEGDYSLLVRGSGAVDFQWQRADAITFTNKFHTVLVEMDRSVYSPGDQVRFRVLIVNASLQPLIPSSSSSSSPSPVLIDVRVTDGMNSGVMMWKNQTASDGMWNNSVQLSSRVAYGFWHISVHHKGQVTRKSFEVVEYVLPGFLVSVDLPPYVLMSSGSVTASVTARYSDGSPVRGDLMVRAYPAIRSTLVQPIFRDQVRRDMDIFGSANVTFNIYNELGVKSDYASRLVFTVIVLDKETRRSENATAFTTLYQSKFTLRMIPSGSHFKPTLKYTVFLVASLNVGVEPQATLGSVDVRHRWTTSSSPLHASVPAVSNSSFTSRRFNVAQDSGIVEVNFYQDSPLSYEADLLQIEADYAGVLYRFSPISAAVSPAKQFLSLELATITPRVGQLASLVAVSTAPVHRLNYHIISRGVLIQSQTRSMSGKFRADFSFRLSDQMVPVVTVLAHYSVYNTQYDQEEIVADSISFFVLPNVNNQVFVDATTLSSRSGTDVEISVKSLPGSLIGLVAVDCELPQIQGGNLLSEAEILRDLDQYNHSPFPRGINSLHMQQRSRIFWNGGSTSYQVFKKLGVMVKTDSLLPQLSADNTSSSRDDLTLQPPAAIAYASRDPFKWAGPFAFSHVAAPFFKHRRLSLLREPGNTWLFDTRRLSSGEGVMMLKKRLQDLPAKWSISAFSLHPDYGLAVASKPAKVMLGRRDLELTLNMATSVKLGEILAVRCVITIPHQLNSRIATITLQHQGDFTIIGTTNDTLQLYAERLLRLETAQVQVVKFVLKPLTVGQLPIRVTVKSDSLTRTVDSAVNVKYEGVNVVNVTSRLVELKGEESDRQFNTEITVGRSYIDGSNSAKVNAYLHVLGAAIHQAISSCTASRSSRRHGNDETSSYLTQQLPAGSGEQNLLQLAAAVITLQLLESETNGAAVNELRSAALCSLRSSYQRQLSYRHNRDDMAGFLMFVDTSSSANVWLSTLVVRWLHMASRFIYVDQTVIGEAVDFVLSQQLDDGSFLESGEIIYELEQTPPFLTSLVIITLAEISSTVGRPNSSQYGGQMAAAVQYLTSIIVAADPPPPHQLSVSVFALAKVQHPASRALMTRLMTQASSQDGELWWRNPVQFRSNTSFWRDAVRSVDVETSGYFILATMQRQRAGDSADVDERLLPAVKWLVKQMNQRGGFISSQDTIVALSALASVNRVLYSGASMSNLPADTKMSVKVQSTSGVRTISVSTKTSSPSSQLSLTSKSSIQLPEPSVGVVSVEVSGESNARGVIQVVHKQHVRVSAPSPSFYLIPRVSHTDSHAKLKLSVCTAMMANDRASGIGDGNMVVMEVHLPSGFTVDVNSVPGIYQHAPVKEVDLIHDHSTVVIYFSEITKQEVCPTILAYLTSGVASHKPSPVVIYDYYDPTRFARQFYCIPEISSCEICDSQQCSHDLCSNNTATFGNNDSLQRLRLLEVSAARSDTVSCISVIVITMMCGVVLLVR